MRVLMLAVFVLLALSVAAEAGSGGPSPLFGSDGPSPLFETEPLFDDEAGGEADADDPAIWVHSDRARRSLVIGTKKNAGLSVFDLRANTLQNVSAPPAPGSDDAPGRFNNVDLIYGFGLAGQRRDLAVTTDRGRDRLRFYAIDERGSASGGPPLTDVTAPELPFVFSEGQDEVNDQATAYGLATWRSPRTGRPYAFVSQRSRTTLAMLELVGRPGGRVGYRLVDETRVPATFRLPDGSRFTPCEDPGDLPQVEGMVADARRGLLFAGQEDVGIYRFEISDSGFGRGELIDKVREFGRPQRFDEAEDECVDDGPDPGFGGDHLSADVEGLTLYYGRGPRGYLLASSQGDDTFAVYGRRGSGPYLGSFELTDGRVDGVQESDGAAVMSVPLGPAFPDGLLVTQDGENTPEVVEAEGEARDNTNFKFTGWRDVADSFDPPLLVDPFSFDPRRP